MNKILVTGASGFVGSHLLEHLLAQSESDIHGTVYGSDNNLAENQSRIHLHELNLLDAAATHELVKKILPTHVYHLAALSSPAASLNSPQETLVNNISAQVNFLEAIREYSPKAKVLIIGSADEYGMHQSERSEIAIDEKQPLNPVTPYAVSKITQDYLGLQYHLTHGTHIVRVRPFNHTGERQVDVFVVPGFAKQIAQIEAGIQPPIIKVGNLESIRDFTDVKDMVQAYELALEKGVPGEVYNLGSGKAMQIKEILDLLMGMADTPIEVEQDPSKMRSADETRLVCNPQKFAQLTGWKPSISIHETLERVLHYWRNKIINPNQQS